MGKIIRPMPNSTGDIVIFNEIHSEAGIVVEGVSRDEEASPPGWWRQYRGVYSYYASFHGWHEFR